MAMNVRLNILQLHPGGLFPYALNVRGRLGDYFIFKLMDLKKGLVKLNWKKQKLYFSSKPEQNYQTYKEDVEKARKIIEKAK